MLRTQKERRKETEGAQRDINMMTVQNDDSVKYTRMSEEGQPRHWVYAS